MEIEEALEFSGDKTIMYEINQQYQSWFNRFRRVLNSCHQDLIHDENTIRSLQIFLLDCGQFNANFTLDELNRLNYPSSPFSIKDRHEYLHTTDNHVAIKVLRAEYLKRQQNKKVFPIFVDSSLFWSELNRYCDVMNDDDLNIKSHDVDNNLCDKPLWIMLDKEFDQSKKRRAKISGRRCIYFYKDNFAGIETIAVLLGKSGKLPQTVTSTIGNLAYRIDPIKATRILLNTFYPQLFLDVGQTRQFWEYYLNNESADQFDTTVNSPDRDLLECVCNYIEHPETNQVAQDTKIDYEYGYIMALGTTPRLRYNHFINYLKQFLFDYKNLYDKNLALNKITGPEMGAFLKLFIEAYRTKNLTLLTRTIHSISEIMLLLIEHQSFTDSLSTLVQWQYLKDFPVQAISVTPFAMRSYVRVFQMLDAQYDGKKPNIYVTNQSYFEWLQNLDRFDKENNSVVIIEHLTEIKEDADIMFVEIHPNNVFNKNQFAQNIMSLLTPLTTTWRKKKRTLVIDIILNALDDVEIQDILQNTLKSVSDGDLTIILIQSLAQLGIDKRSAGLLIVINKGDDENLHQKLISIEELEPTDRTTIQFFTYFLKIQSSIKSYIENINENVRYVYSETLLQTNMLEIVNQRRCQITMSSDPKACYVELNLNGLLPEVTRHFNLRLADLEKFSKQLIQYLILPLCEFYKIPLTQRVSIGFPMSSVNLAYASLRFTIGMESDDELLHLAEILSYTAFVLNRQRDAMLFFKKDSDEYSLRVNYFKEKLEQFKAMTPKSKYTYVTRYDAAGPQNTFRNAQGETRQLKIIAEYNDGSFTLQREVPTPSGTKYIQYSPRHIFVPVRRLNDTLSLDDRRISDANRRLYASCFSAYTLSSTENYQNVKCIFHDKLEDRGNTVTLSSMEIIGLWNMPTVYGPYIINNSHFEPVYLFLHQKNIIFLCGNKPYSDDCIVIKKGNLLTSLSDMPLDEQEFVMREGAFEAGNSTESFYREYRKDLTTYYPETQYTPTKNEQMTISFSQGKFILERDFICSQHPGIKLYKRYHGEEETCIQLDYLIEKDPVLVRFLTLMIAVYAKEISKIDFLARDANYSQFLFQVSFNAADSLMYRSVSQVLRKRHQLVAQFNRHKTTSYPTVYLFSNSQKLAWHTREAGISQFDDKELIETGLKELTG